MSPGTHRRFLGFICWETGRDVRNMVRVAFLFLLWAVGGEVVSYLQVFVVTSTTLDWVLAFVPAIPGILTVLAYVKFLREADEMIRRIHLTGMAVGFGAGLFVWLAFQAPLHHGDLIAFKQMFMVERIHRGLILIAMLFGWAYGQSVATRRYK